jgi:hypothetical protein
MIYLLFIRRFSSQYLFDALLCICTCVQGGLGLVLSIWFRSSPPFDIVKKCPINMRAFPQLCLTTALIGGNTQSIYWVLYPKN